MLLNAQVLTRFETAIPPSTQAANTTNNYGKSDRFYKNIAPWQDRTADLQKSLRECCNYETDALPTEPRERYVSVILATGIEPVISTV